MSVTRVRITSRSSFNADTSEAIASLDASRARSDSSSRVSCWFSSAARACSDFIRSIIPTSSFSFSSSRSIGSSSTLRVTVFAIELRSLSLYGLMLTNECTQNRLDALVHLGVGQSAVGCLKRQPHRETHSAVRYAFALIAVEERQRDERRRERVRGGENGATNDLGRQGTRDDDREVANDERMTRERHGRVARRGERTLEQIEVQLCDADPILARQVPRVGRRRRQNSDDADGGAARRAVGDQNRRRLAGDQIRLAHRLEADRDAERLGDLFGRALHVEEVHLARAARPVIAGRRPGPCDADGASLAAGREAGADLEETHVAAAVAAVVRDRVYETRQQRRPQRVEQLRQRGGGRDPHGRRRGPRARGGEQLRPPWPDGPGTPP